METFCIKCGKSFKVHVHVPDISVEVERPVTEVCHTCQKKENKEQH